MKKITTTIIVLLTVLISNAQNSLNEAPTAATPGVLTVTATESTAGGNYKPKHCTAIWIQDANGKFVKTLLAYAATRKQYLTNWKNNTNASGKQYSTTDAISGATVTTFDSRTCTWNGTDLSSPRVVLPDGTYTIKMELTDKNSTGNLATFTFVKGSNAVALTPANQPSFSNVSIQWIPTATGINDIRLSNLYSVSPNPSKSIVHFNGPDINEIEICMLNGQQIFVSKTQDVDINKMPKGAYIAKISTKNGTFVKKFIKE